jgi:hypothetical protein
MSTVSTIDQIDQSVLTYTPLALQTIAAIEVAAAGLPGQTKAQIASNIILASANATAGIPVPSVQAIGGLIGLLVSILNATGVFKKKPVTVAPVPVVSSSSV